MTDRPTDHVRNTLPQWRVNITSTHHRFAFSQRLALSQRHFASRHSNGRSFAFVAMSHARAHSHSRALRRRAWSPLASRELSSSARASRPRASLRARLAFAFVLAAAVVARAEAQCTSTSESWPLALGNGVTYDEPYARAVETTYFTGFASYVHWDGTLGANAYTKVSEGACASPQPPSPPPSPPPPPAQASFAMALEFAGYSKSELDASAGARERIRGGIAAFLGIDEEEVVIEGFEDATTTTRRRDLLATRVRLRFRVNTPTYTDATTLASTMTTVASDPSGLTASMKKFGLPFLSGLVVTPPTGVAAPPPPPPSPPPPPPSPPPECGNGVLVTGVEDGCEQGFGQFKDLPVPWGCVTKCTTREGWVCTGNVANGIEYGLFNPNSLAAMCNCSNPAGTYASSYVATQDEACQMTPVAGVNVFPTCLYPERCLANGAGCATGSEGINCKFCQIGYFKSGSICEKCGDNTIMNVAIAVVCIILFGVVGFKTAEALGNTSISIIKNMANSFQFFSISFSVDIDWPSFITKVGDWFKAFNFNIEFVAPECIAQGGISWNLIFWSSTVVVPGSVFGFIILLDRYNQWKYLRTLNKIHSEKQDDGETVRYWIEKRSIIGRLYRAFEDTSGEKIVLELARQYRSRASLRSFAVLCLTIMYLPVVRVCLQAFDCTETTEGQILTYDANVYCTDVTHIVAQVAAAFFLLVIGVGLPVAVIWKVRQIRVSGKLDDAQTIDTYGALYDVYRRPDLTSTDKLEIAITAKKLMKQKSDAQQKANDAQAAAEAGAAVGMGRRASLARSSSRFARSASLRRDDSKLSSSKSMKVDAAVEVATAAEENVIDKETQEFIDDCERDDAEAKAKTDAVDGNEPAEKAEKGAMPGTSEPLAERQGSRQGSAKSFSLQRTFRTSASTRARDAAERMTWRDRFALYYLSVEMVQKLGAVLGGSPQITPEADAYVLTAVFGLTAIFVAWAQPWRIIALGFGKWRLNNTLNRVEATAMFLQCLVTVLPLIFENYSTVATSFIMGIIMLLFSVRLLMFVSERMGVKRDKRMDLEKRPEQAMTLYQETIVTHGRLGNIIRMYATKFDFAVQRRKVRARMEAVRDAMFARIKLMRAETEPPVEQIDALYKIANDMAFIVNALTSDPDPGGESVESVIQRIEGELEADLIAEERREATTKPTLESEALNLIHVVHAYDKARFQITSRMYVYAKSEMISEIALLGGADKIMGKEQMHCPVGFGHEKLIATEVEFTRVDAPYVTDLIRSIETDDIDLTIKALDDAHAIILRHIEWMNAQFAVFAAPGDHLDASKVLVNNWALDVARRELYEHEAYLEQPITITILSLATLFKDYGKVMYAKYLERLVQCDVSMRTRDGGPASKAERHFAMTAIRKEYMDWCREVVVKLGKSKMNARFNPVSKVIAASVGELRTSAMIKMIRRAKKESRKRRGVRWFGK